MKKLLTTLTITGLISITGIRLVACNGGHKLQYVKKVPPEDSQKNQNKNVNNSHIEYTIRVLNDKINILN